MIYIISQHSETVTDEVVAYCIQEKNHVVRIDYEDMPLQDLTMNISRENINYSIVLLNKELLFTQNDILWFRRGSIKFEYAFKEQILSQPCIDFLKEEYSYIGENYYTIPFSISNYQADPRNNKLDNLIFAKQSGLKIPNTIVTSSKKAALNFLNKHGRSITKPLNNGHFNDKILGEISITSRGTFEITATDFETLDETFAPMLMQAYVEKEFEFQCI